MEREYRVTSEKGAEVKRITIKREYGIVDEKGAKVERATIEGDGRIGGG